MGKLYEQKINDFTGGLSDSPRQPIFNMGSLIKHFDIFSDGKKLTPYRSTEADTATNVSATDAKQYDIRDFQLGLDGKLYALGKNGSGYPKVMTKADPTTGNWLASDGSNAATAIGEGNGARISGCFIEWQGAFWFFQGTNQVAKCTLAGTITNSVATVGSTITSVAQGVINNNTLYLFYNNKVVTVSAAGAVSDNVFTTIPSDMRITSATRYGSYLAIGCAYGTATTTKPVGRSVVVIWDMVQTTTASDVIDWGEGALRVLGIIEGRICGVSDKYLSSSLGLTRGSMVIRLWAGGAPQVMKELIANQTVTANTATVTRFPNNVIIKNNKMYWAASVPFALSTSTESTYHLGIWVFGRKNVNSNFALSLDYIEEGVSASNFFINSFGSAGDYWFINHSADGSVTKTDDTATYSFTSIYETQILNGGDSSEKKKLLGVTVYTAPLPAAGNIVLKYRLDEETSFTQIFTDGTDNSLSHSAINIESTGVTLPEFKEIIFRIESTGGAEITGLKFKYEVIDKDIY